MQLGSTAVLLLTWLLSTPACSPVECSARAFQEPTVNALQEPSDLCLSLSVFTWPAQADASGELPSLGAASVAREAGAKNSRTEIWASLRDVKLVFRPL